jgi:NADP-dependent 3-hydroxy acid dehydrogenase YdfG
MRETIVVGGVGKDNLGRAVVDALLKQGFSVTMLARSESALQEILSSYQGKLADSVTLDYASFDLSDEIQVTQYIKKCFKSNIVISGFINTTGIWMGHKPVEQVTQKDLLKSITGNTLPTINFVSALLEHQSNHKFTLIDLSGATSSMRVLPDAATEFYSFWAGKRLLYGYMKSLIADVKSAKLPNLKVYQYIIDGLLDNSRTRKLSPDYDAEKFISQDEIASHLLGLLTEPSLEEVTEFVITHNGIACA